MNLKLTNEQFDVITAIESSDKLLSASELSRITNLEQADVDVVLDFLNSNNLIENNKVSQKGYEVLEQYRVKRAIFIAAGFGSRLVPITLETPKPLVKVNGKRMIDTIIDAVLSVGIEELYIVRGYKGERFDELLPKYPMIKFIDNPYYNEANNISSALLTREFMKNAYVLEADLVLYNPKIITKYQYASNYLGVWTDETDDWCFETEGKYITKVKICGQNLYQMYGISYWTEEDATKLCDDIKAVYEMPDGKQKYWDEVPLVYRKDNYKVQIRPCNRGDIIEIDTLDDLKKIDKSYSNVFAD